MTAMIEMNLMAQPDAIRPVNFNAELDLLLDLYTLGMREHTGDETFPRPLVSDPAYQTLSTVAYRLGNQRQSINEAILANMLAYAKGNDLAHLGANVNVARLVVQEADETANPPQEEILEDEERFRRRIQMAFESWTTAGSRGSYEYHTLTASALVKDVFIDKARFQRIPVENEPTQLLLECTHDARLTNPIPGDIAVTLLLEEGADKTEIWGKVEAALDDDTVIPLTDNRTLLEPEIIEYEVIATLYFYPGPSVEPAIQAATEQLQAYTVANYKLGHDIAVSGLHGAAHRNGCQRVELNLTDDLVVQPWQAAKCTNITVNLGGRDV